VKEGQTNKRLTSTKQHGEISIKFYCIDAVAMPIKDGAGEFELAELVRQGTRHDGLTGAHTVL
jgi:hypothetical protein